MSLLDTLKGLFGGGGSNTGGTFGILQSLVSASGGLSGLLGKLKQAGLSSQVQSWIGLDKNEDVTGEQLEQAIGGDQLSALAQKFGLSADQVKTQLASILPKVVDKLTPTGQVPEEGAVSNALTGLKDLLGSK